jgi:anti-sigma regulatory factor (Ser/Thr protein kinase)
VTDEGGGFDPEVIPDPRYGDNLYKPAGRGMLLMRSFMDVVEYSKQGNSVLMIRYREKQHPAKSAVRTNDSR